MVHTTQTERDKYRSVWGLEEYRLRSPGLRHLKSALQWMQPPVGSSVTDWGAGSGQASDAMHEQGYKVRLVDIATNCYRGSLPLVEACLWELPESLEATDYGFCADVMEHIPTDHVDEVFRGIKDRTRVACYFQIALFDDRAFTHAGPLHLSVFPPEWWKARIEAVFSSAEYQQIRQKHLLVVARP